MTLRVAIVAYELLGERSGVGRYLEGLLRGAALAEPPIDATFRLFSPGSRTEAVAAWVGDLEDALGDRLAVEFDPQAGSSAIVWEQTRLPRRLRRHRFDVLFSPGYSLPPFVRAPRVVTLHDLSFEHLGEEFAPKERWRRRILARLAARRATRVLVDTEAMARDLQKTYRIERAKLGIVPLAVDRRFFEAASQHAASVERPEALASLPPGAPYLLWVGTILPRRPIEAALEAFARLGDDHPDLHFVIAGRDRRPAAEPLEETAKRLGVGARVVRLPYAPEDALPALYAGAAASIYLSTYEGYGLPPLESLAAGTPAVSSRGLALDDLLPDSPWCPLDTSPSEVEAALRRALAAQSDDVERARATVRELDWVACALAWIAELRRAAESGAVR